MNFLLLTAAASSNTLESLYAIADKVAPAILGAAITLGGIWLKNRAGSRKVELQHELNKARDESDEATRIRVELRSDLDTLRRSLQTIQQELETERRVKLHLLEQIMFLQARSRLMQTNSENIITWLKAKGVDFPETLCIPIPAQPESPDVDLSK